MSKFNVKNSQFLVGTAGGAPANVVGQVRQGDVDLGEVSIVDSTVTTDSRESGTPGVRDSMGGSFTVAWDPSLGSTAGEHSVLMAAYLAGTLVALGFKLRDQQATPGVPLSVYGDGYVTNITAPIASGGGNALMECTVTFKLSGAATITVV